MDIRLGDPSDLWRETLNVVLFLFQPRLRDKHGEIAVLHAELFDFGVEKF
jgi:hypothetical protein